ncbi:MAG: phage portal protein [bacterium]|nr:phage portal protein [bacterium]
MSDVPKAFVEMRNDYAAAKSSRHRRTRRGISSTGSGADYHYRNEADYLRLMETARDMDRNDAVIGQMIDRAVVNTIQGGIQVSPETGDPDLDADLLTRWTAWADDPDACDLTGEFDFHTLEGLVMRAVFVDGDILALPLIDGQIETVEAHRLRTPSNTKKNVVHGVKLDDRRRRLEYWLAKDNVDPMRPLVKVSDVSQYKARDADGNKQVLHVYNPRRVSQTRGISALAPIFDVAGMFEDINFAKLVQQQVVSCFTIFRTRDETLKPLPEDETETLETRPDGSSRILDDMGPGRIVDGAAGEKLEGFSPRVPNAEFFKHAELMLTLMSINLGMPLGVVLLTPTGTFSGWRGAIDQARLGFRHNQRWMIARFHRPTYLWKVRQWLAEDATLRAKAARSGVNIFGHNWHPPTWPYIDPFKDAAADLLRVRNNIISPRRLQAERGRVYEKVMAETIEDHALAVTMAKKRAVAINGAFDDGQPVHWRDLVSMPTPDGVQVSLDTAMTTSDKEEETDAA